MTFGQTPKTFRCLHKLGLSSIEADHARGDGLKEGAVALQQLRQDEYLGGRVPVDRFFHVLHASSPDGETVSRAGIQASGNKAAPTRIRDYGDLDHTGGHVMYADRIETAAPRRRGTSWLAWVTAILVLLFALGY